MTSKDHWETVYATKPVDSVSWFQPHASQSAQLVGETGVAKSAAIIDVGGGASTLVDDLLRGGYANLTVLDLSASALEASRKRLGADAGTVRWVEADILDAGLPDDGYDVWHDRAVFHFLTQPEDRRTYVRALTRAVKAGGHVIMATFAEDGPVRCSGLPVMRYSPEGLADALGNGFTLVQTVSQAHQTPAGATQKFLFCRFRKV